MKKLIILLFVLIALIKVSGQVFVTIEPAHFRPGILYNHQFSTFGIYAKTWYGDIQKRTPYDYFYTQNIKIGLGTSFKLTEESNGYFGMNRSYYFGYSKKSELSDLNKVHKVSFDVGVDFKVTDHLTLLMMSDLLNWESCIGINYKLK